MNIVWRNDVLCIVWIGKSGIEFDLNPNTYPALLKAGQHRALGAALVEFGEAIKNGKVEKTESVPAIFGPNGRRIN
jgi:hypothetical protein